MGVDFIGYTNIKMEPLPPKFRPKLTSKSVKENLEFEIELLRAPKEYRDLIMATAGASYDANGKIVLPLEVEVPQEAKDEFYETMMADPDFITVCWETQTIYKKTPETIIGSSGRSYSGYGDFCGELKYLNKGPLDYLPPSTDSAPEYGIVSTEKCSTLIKALNKIRYNFVSDSWIPDHTKYCDCNNTRYEEDFPKDDERNEHSWFFREFYTVFSLGAQNGIVRIT